METNIYINRYNLKTPNQQISLWAGHQAVYLGQRSQISFTFSTVTKNGLS